MNQPAHESHRRRPDLAVFLSELAQGGIGKMRVHLMNAFVDRGLKVDLVLGKPDSPYREMLSGHIRVIDNRTSHALFGVPRFAGYLATTRPPVTLVQRIRVNVLAHRARALARSRTRLYVTANTHISRQLESMPPRKREKQLAQLRRYYPRNAGIIAVSRGVANDLAQLIDVPPERIRVAPNPSASPAIFEQARAPVQHPWFDADAPPVVLGAGRLQPQKDFPTLLRAFALVRSRREARLVILGEGPLREALLSQARELGIEDDVHLPGFVTNPYPLMQASGVFALSSAWEGSPNALAEALALGTPVVATDCPSGPYEILEGGRHGSLVPVGDHEALAAAIERTLDEPPSRAALQKAGERYSLERSASAYLEALQLDR